MSGKLAVAAAVLTAVSLATINITSAFAATANVNKEALEKATEIHSSKEPLVPVVFLAAAPKSEKQTPGKTERENLLKGSAGADWRLLFLLFDVSLVLGALTYFYINRNDGLKQDGSEHKSPASDPSLTG